MTVLCLCSGTAGSKAAGRFTSLWRDVNSWWDFRVEASRQWSSHLRLTAPSNCAETVQLCNEQLTWRTSNARGYSDMTSCEHYRCVYMGDHVAKCVHRLDVQGGAATEWSVSYSPTALRQFGTQRHSNV